ncbi:MAG TPA: hypothetical protein VIA81_01205 [Acidimicrobiia bacterium]
MLVGVAIGTLASGLVFAIGLLLARASRAEAAPGLVLTTSLLIGLVAAGYCAGRLAPFNGRFHGSIAALGIAAVVLIVARLGGSPAPIAQVLLLALIAAVLGGVAGWMASRQR